MSQSEGAARESASIIQEIESQLDRILSKRKDDIERSLAGTILKEKELARRKLDEAEKEFEGERDFLHEFKTMVAENEAERNAVLEEIRERHKRILRCQEDISALAKRTVEEMRKVGELNRKLESLREKTAERAGFLKNDLRERFGIISDIPDMSEAPEAPLSLDEELEKLRKIRDLLAGESPAVPGGEEADAPSFETEKGSGDIQIPEIRDLVQASSYPADATSRREGREEDEASRGFAGVLEGLRKTEPVGNGDTIGYFQNGSRIILDTEGFMSFLGDCVDDAKKLSLRLGETETPKDRFLIKHHLINGQEKLRKVISRAVRLCEKSLPGFPGKTRDALNAAGLREMLDRLAAENWANSEDLASFEKTLNAMKAGYRTGSIPRNEYAKSILEDLGAL
jgi:hypothetical protein